MDAYTMNLESAVDAAITAVESLHGRNDHVQVSETVFVGIDGDDTFWVTDAEEENTGMNHDEAIDAVVESLMQVAR